MEAKARANLGEMPWDSLTQVSVPLCTVPRLLSLDLAGKCCGNNETAGLGRNGGCSCVQLIPVGRAGLFLLLGSCPVRRGPWGFASSSLIPRRRWDIGSRVIPSPACFAVGLCSTSLVFCLNISLCPDSPSFCRHGGFSVGLNCSVGGTAGAWIIL